MIYKYNRYCIILICLLCNSIIAISEQQSLTDKPIVDNIPLNNSIGSNKKSIKTSKKFKALKRKKKKLRKTALRKSSKGSKHKTVNNKSKESTPLSKWAKISLGAIVVVGGVGLLIRPSRKLSTSSSSSTLRGTSSSLNQGEIFQESGSKTLLDNSSNIPLEQEQYFSLDQLEKLKKLFEKLKSKRYQYTIDSASEIEIINKDFRKLKIDEKIQWILHYSKNYIVYQRKCDTLCDIGLQEYLISLIEQNEIN